jgi:long-chain acyl-CoA synthetase
MQQLSQVLQSLPVDHPAKIGYQTWPCGDHIVNGLCFVNGPRSMRQLIISCFHKKDNPHFGSSEFLKFKDEVLTYDQAWQHISALGAALVNDFGIRGGDRVAISMRNYPEWIIAFLAIMCVGGVVCPLNSLWKESEMEYGLADSGTKVLFCDAERLVYAKSALSKLQIPAIVCRGSGGSGGSGGATYTNTYTNVVGRRRGETLPSYPSSLTIDSTAAIFYTSGSTGNPKGVCQTHRGMTNQIYQPIALRMLQGNSTPLKQQAQQAIICPVPLFHVTGCHHLFLSALTSGSRLILMYKWDAGEALKLIERERPTSWTGVPTQVQDLMEHPDFAKYDTSSLKRLGGGGAPTPVSQVEKVKNKFKGGGSAGNGYGLTETNGGICTIFGDDYRKRPTSCGQPLPLVEVIVVIAGEQNTEDGSYKFIATPNTRGELLIRSALVMKEYWNKPKKNQESLVAVDNGKGGGWFRTGDIAELDSENYIYIVDRL